MKKREKGGRAMRYFYSRMIWIACYCCIYTSMFAQRIPVVVHIISSDPYSVTDAQIISAINDLNDAFAHTGAYGSGPGANTGITFCLARIDPLGGISNGITRTKSVLGDFDADIENDRMKNLVSWDPRQYCNIWYVKDIKSEIYPMYSCGKWTRMKEGGYATYSSGGDFRDGVVVTAFGQLLAHEVGHYLGLLHTFSIANCTNNNCDTDGDGICDTPPSSVFGGSCSSPQNSCSSDTLSGFPVDVPDLNVNFMSYSACTNMFTDGQALKMRTNLTTARGSLLLSNKCDPPCGENILASFTRDDWSPVTGSTINFSSTSTGGSNYEWNVDGVVTGSNSPAMSYTFPANGKFKVTLKVFNGNPACYSTYSDDIIVTCGVMARFYPDKRIIASKAPIMLDTILFTNRSENAASYEWLMGNDMGMSEQVVSTDANLNYSFAASGNYTVRLIASNGACRDTTQTFHFVVADPTVDGNVNFSAEDCYQQTKVRVVVSVCNSGYATIPAGTPISFYDGDPRLPGATKLDTTFLLPQAVAGKCCGNSYILVLDAKKSGLNKIFAVFNDNGLTLPVTLPNTALPELNYADNFRSASGFKFAVSIVPPSSTLEPGDTLQLKGTGAPGLVSTYTWSPASGLSCTNCKSPFFIAGKDDEVKKLVAVSQYGCIDSAVANIKVPPADDYIIKINRVDCYHGDSLLTGFTICNQFKRGVIPKNLKVTFYDADPANGNAKILGPVFSTPANANTSCVTYTHIIKGSGPLPVYAVVNDKGDIPFKVPNDTVSAEKDYTNNKGQFNYRPDSVIIFPSDTTVLRKQPVPLTIQPPVYDPASIKWLPGSGYTLSCGNCLATTATVNASTVIRMQMKGRYGCMMNGEARVSVLPPDMVIRIMNTHCYTNGKTLVNFSICMNNGYDNVFPGIPVSFYDGDPYAGRPALLDNSFRTPTGLHPSCDTFSAVIPTPANGNVYAAVNDGGVKNFPDTAFSETDLTNNLDTVKAVPFRAFLIPPDTTIYRTSEIQLFASVNGGLLRSFQWKSAQYLSCSDCLDPVAKPPYSQEFIFSAVNEFGCTADARAMIRTFTDGRVNIPNAFTPNNDGRNDIFYVLGSRDISLIREFNIYDRYGQQVFHIADVPANNPLFGWNGTNAGKTLATGTFVYRVLIQFAGGQQELFKGTVTLIR